MTEAETISGHAVVMAYCARFECVSAATRITFPDLPGVTVLAEGTDDAFAVARDALHTAVSELITTRSPIPRPSRKPRRQHGDSDRRFERTVPLEQALGMKAILWDNMRNLGISNVALAKHLGCDEKEVRRLLDPTITSRTRLADALEAVGCPIAVTTIDTGRPTRILRLPGQPGHYTTNLEPAVAAPGTLETD
jgi:antitoxin HicB